MAIRRWRSRCCLGAIGLPLPIGVATVLAGSLAALGTLRWEWAAAVAVIASFAGDIIAYGIGRAVSENFLARHGRWIGYTAERKAHVQALLRRWGGMTVIISRTLTSSLSSIVSLFAGVGRYGFARFLSFAAGRPADLDLGLSRPGLRRRQQYRGRQPVPRQFERARDRARRAGGGGRLSGRRHAARRRVESGCVGGAPALRRNRVDRVMAIASSRRPARPAKAAKCPPRH